MLKKKNIAVILYFERLFKITDQNGRPIYDYYIDLQIVYIGLPLMSLLLGNEAEYRVIK